MRKPYFFAVMTVAVLFASVVLLPSASAAPDARLVFEDVSVSDDRPEPGEIVNLSVTVANSAGSTEAVEIDRLQLRDRGGGPLDAVDTATTATRSGVGSLSPGDSVTVPLTVSFEEPGYKRLDLYVRATDQDRETGLGHTSGQLLVGSVDVDEIEVDLGVNARLTDEQPDEEPQDEDEVGNLFNGDLGGIGGDGIAGDGGDGNDGTGEAFEVRVTNFGNVDVRNAVVVPREGDEELPRIAVGEIEPFAEETVRFEPDAVEPTTYSFEVRYTVAGESYSSTYTTEYVPETARLTVTDVGMERDEETGAVVVTGNVGNTGFGTARGTVVSVGEADGVEPSYPSADDFVGEVPESDFTFFELTAEVDGAETLPVEARYSTDGQDIVETFELPVEVVETESDEDDGGTTFGATVIAIAVVAVSATAYLWRKRRR